MLSRDRRQIGDSLARGAYPIALGAEALHYLWLGTPVLTLQGAPTWQRTTASLLLCAGLGDWVANTPQTYVSKAVAALTGDADTAIDRARIRQQLSDSALLDAAGYAKVFMAALDEAWAEISA